MLAEAFSIIHVYCVALNVVDTHCNQHAYGLRVVRLQTSRTIMCYNH